MKQMTYGSRARWAALGILVLSLGMASMSRAEEGAERSRTLSLRSGLIDVLAPAKTLPVELTLRSATDPQAERYTLVKFDGPVSAADYAALEGEVERIYTYLPHDAFLVKLKPAQKAARLMTAGRVPGVLWSGAYQPAYKLSPEVLTLAGAATERIVMVQIFPDADLEQVARRVEALGLNIVGQRQGARWSRIRLLASPAEIAAQRNALAQIPEVFWVDTEARRVLLNDTTIWVSQSGTSGGQATPIFDQGIYGEGQIVGVLDTGIDADMCYFRDTVNGLPPINACNGGTVVNLNQRKVIAVDFLWSNECSGGIGSNEWDTQDHGSHVAGTVAGDNFANPLTHDPGDGIAPGAKLVIQDCGFQTDNCADCPGIGCPVVDLNPIFQQAYDQGARIHTNSWGDAENDPNKGRYTAGSQDADEFMWNHKDMLLLFAAGNDGPGTGSIGSPSTGKNVVAVGSTLRGTSANSMSSFSSCGPTNDGRIKPDITMPGSSIISANADNNTGSNNCNTKSSSGTSMASPGAAGSVALIRQYYQDGWYPSGAPVGGDALTPSAALLKATLINSGTDMTNVTAIPSNCQGWGRVRLDDALHFAGEARELEVVDDTVGFPQGSSGATQTFNYAVNAGEPLKVTLTWTDFPAVPLASPTLINDLDLEVSGPSGTFRGNVFSGGASTTGGTADRLNTVEQVLLANPAAGTYTVTVRAFTVPQGPQPFAVVVTGDFGSSGNNPPAVNITAPSNGSSFVTGSSVAFSGTATDIEDGTLTGALSWSSNLDGVIGSGGSFATSTLSLGTHTITAAVTDSGALSGSDQITVTIVQSGGCTGCIDWNTTATVSYADQDVSGNVAVEDAGATLFLQANSWRRTTQSFTLTANTVVEFDFRSTDQGEIHGVGFDNNDTLNDAPRHYQIWGTQNWTGTGRIGLTSPQYDGSGNWQSFSIPVGQDLTGSFFLVLINDNDSGTGNGRFRNVRVFEDTPPPPPPGCAVEVDFSAGASGWTNSGSCSTGAFVAGTPTLVTNGGVTTQVSGDHTTGSGNAWFTAPNSSAGVNDVDGGSCVTTSPVYPVAAASDLSIWYFHGQRDAGGDAADGFRVELSTNGGSTWSDLLLIGDVTVNAAWTELTTSVAAGANVRLRVTATDGTASGDLVEGGLDDLSICEVP